MNEHENDETLRWQLHGLRRDIEPPRDLWSGIAARVAALPVAAVPDNITPPRRHAPRWLPLAMAASLLLVFGLFWRQPGITPGMPTGDPLIQREAVAMSRHYQGAFAEFPQTSETSTFTPAIRDLDRSAAQIMAAIAQDPESRFLLEQLRRTYARRLVLTQRATLT